MRWPDTLLFIGVLGCCLFGCKPSEATRVSKQAVAPDGWTLSCVDPHVATPAWLSNGLIGVRLSRSGTAFDDANDTVEPFFAIDAYDPKGEEKIQPLPNPMGLEVLVDGHELNASQGSDYSQTLSMKSACLLTHWVQGGSGIDLETYISPTKRVLVQRAIISAGGKEVEVHSSISGGKVALQGTPQKSVGELIPGLQAIVAQQVEGANGSWKSSEGRLTYKGVVALAGAPVVVYRSVTMSGRTAVGDEDAKTVFEATKAECEKVWAERWKTDVVIDGPVEDQQVVRSFLFYLQMAISPNAKMAVSPMALSDSRYNGHVFWDADIWVFPALSLLHPDLARTIPNYRLALADQARKNTTVGARYPWESSVSGRETVPGPSQKELHITGSVLWGLDQAAALGLADPVAVSKLKADAAAYYASITKDGQIRDVMSPDENHIGDNDLYTNLLAQWLTGKPYKLPRDSKTFLTYDNDALRGYKQAAAVLSIYPLQYGPAEQEAKAMMERFANKVTANGPAMTDSVHATIWARIGEPDLAYTTWQKGWKDFTNNPLLLFSEKRKKPTTYFTTGAAGCLQTVLYGFLGFRLDSPAKPKAAWTTKLAGEHWLSVSPNLPKAWKSVTLTHFLVAGKHYSFTASHDGTKVSVED